MGFGSFFGILAVQILPQMITNFLSILSGGGLQQQMYQQQMMQQQQQQMMYPYPYQYQQYPQYPAYKRKRRSLSMLYSPNHTLPSYMHPQPKDFNGSIYNNPFYAHTDSPLPWSPQQRARYDAAMAR